MRSLYPDDPEKRHQVEELEQKFARKLGVWTRVVAYHHIFADRDRALNTLALRQPGLPAWRSRVLQVVYPAVRGAICRGLRVNEKGAAACLKRVQEMFDEVGGLLRDNPSGPHYLVGDHFTAADLTFAAMAAILICPPEYGAYVPPLEGQGHGRGEGEGDAGEGIPGTWPQGFPGYELAQTPAGLYALEVYRRHRGRPGPTPPLQQAKL